MLTDDDFENGVVLNGVSPVANGVWYIKFYAPWCPHCQKIKNTWNQVADHFYGSGVKVGKVDCTQEIWACDHMNMTGYPGIFVLEGANAYPFEGGNRTLDRFIEFVEKHEYKKHEEPNLIPVGETIKPGVLMVVYTNFSKLISSLFALVGLDWLPPQLQQIALCGFFVVPAFVCFCPWFDSKPKVNKTHRT